MSRDRVFALWIGQLGAAHRALLVRYMHDEALAVLPDLLAQLQIENPILIGHSDGASIAIIYAGAHDNARGLVLLAPHVFVEDLSVASIAQAKIQFETNLAEFGAPSSRCGENFLGMERDLAPSGISQLEHRRIPAANYLPGPGDSRHGRSVRNHGAGRSDKTAGCGQGGSGCSGELSPLAAARSARGGAGSDPQVRNPGLQEDGRVAQASPISRAVVSREKWGF